MSTNIPLARKQLQEIAKGLRNSALPRFDAAGQIDEIVDTLMIRSFTGRKAPTKHRKMTDEIAADVRIYAAQNPAFSHEEIAKPFDINAGRVSEVLAGKRFVAGRAV